MKARFISSDPTETDTVYGGIEFPVNGPYVDVPAALGARLATSPCFEVDTDGDDEPGPTVDELREALDARGITYSARAGVKKLGELLAEAEAAEAAPATDGDGDGEAGA